MHSKLTEKSLLGCLMNNPQKLAEVESAGGIRLFYINDHQDVYVAIRKQADSGDGVDFATICTRSKMPRSFLEDIKYHGTSGLMIEAYVNQLKELVVLREVKNICHLTLDKLIEDDEHTPPPAPELITEVSGQVHDLSMYLTKPRGNTAAELLDEVWNYYIDNEGTTPDFLKTGFRDLDLLMDGLQPSENIIVAARPSVGKSACAMDIARNVAKQGKRVLFFSMEMTPERLVQRMLCAETMVCLKRLRNNQLRIDEWAKAQRMYSQVSEYAQRIILVPGQIGINDVKARALQEMHERGLDLVIIDYLQLMKTVRGSGMSTNDIVGANCNGLQLLSKELNIPVVTLSQLSRASEKEKRKPILSDLRDSGNIEQSGDKIILMYKENREATEVELIVAKSKDGPVGAVKIAWIPESVTFRDLARGVEDQ